jgi:hypothetical protein
LGVDPFFSHTRKVSKFVSDNLPVHVAGVLTVDATLRVGAISDEITVTAAATAIDRTTAELGQVVDARRIAELPIREGTAVELVILAPGVTNSVPPGPVGHSTTRRRRRSARTSRRSSSACRPAA